jgi:hypothetical protein
MRVLQASDVSIEALGERPMADRSPVVQRARCAIDQLES